MSLWFPRLSTDRILRRRLGRSWRSGPTPAGPPLLVSRRENNTQRVAALDERAGALRLRPGLGVADARAIHPSVEVVEEEPEADRRLLEALADWCDRFTPLVALDGRDGLFLDITGCAHLFGGEQAMLRAVVSGIVRQGIATRGGIAATPGAAWAAARFAGEAILEAGKETSFLAALPLAALRLDPGIRAGLEGVGLRTVGAVAAVPRAPLARRFGQVLVLRLDQALGRIEEAVSPRRPVPPLSVERRFAEPLVRMEDIEGLVPLLAGGLRQDLERRGEGARRLELVLFRVDGAVSRLSVSASRPMRAPDLVGRLFRERLARLGEGLDAGWGFDLVRLCAVATAAFESPQADLAAGSGSAEDEDMALFADRVRARFGEDTIRVPVIAGSHLPERAARLAAQDHAPSPAARAVAAPLPERPLRLLARAEPVEVPLTEVPEGPPIHFRWRRALHRVARAEGPERIESEWWLRGISRDEPGEDGKEADRPEAETTCLTRDYFRVEDTDGRRYWLYREGLYEISKTPPRWFMQGFCA